MNEQQVHDLAAVKILVAVLAAEIIGRDNRQKAQATLDRIRSMALNVADNANIQAEPGLPTVDSRAKLKQALEDLLSGITLA